ncbi:ABC transporter ATP-binding protein [Parapusillimonas granuli]|uniref:ABC transporter ATP-binding protein n=1 Tax=Parapusillimonas granuli TaxID=380911 RepID=A0A853G2N2_9BURK|nr:ABC transporter ATP-binding protein [Parapusillimonas granuli]MBB5217135.1 branched-chain amino acid transport system ATP-binding protein [Parapusillimonas granuli]MEB2401600.1 ABC transporter ATP-binding protein [Alcaligenaceae bacterium]NYT50102.1 ABC transporter ATP-binding protein [Parapusillimonas granuli]
MSLLEVDKINSYYGDSHILFDVSLHVEEHEVVALLGRNGAGKSTTLKSLMGVVQPKSGRILHKGEEVQHLPPFQLARRGIQLVPEERRIFGQITVHENLQLAAMTAPQPRSLDEIYETFPRLAERKRNRGKQLSGGEQQMLAIARAMIRNASIIMLDEPFEGLAPLIVRDLMEVCRKLADGGHTIVIVEQNVRAALSLADRCYLINNGHMVYEGTPAQLHADTSVIEKYLGVKV